MRICTAVAVLIGQAFAQREEFCGTATLLDQTSLLQNLQIQKNVAIQDVGELQTTSAEHMFDQAVAVLQNVQNTPGIAAFADYIRSQITADDGFLAAIQAAHAADQLELVGLWAEVVSSMTAAQDQIKEIEHVQSDVGIVATSHGICRQDEFPMCMVVDDCHVRLEDAEAELITAESVVSSTQTAIKTSWCGNDGSMQLAFRDGARPILSVYLSQEIIADTKRAARDAIQSECDAKEVLRLAKRGECNSVQVNFEVQSCQLATLIRHSSDLTEQQVHAATIAYQIARTDVEAQEEIRKKEFLTLTRTECLLDRIHEAGELPCDENTSNQNDVAAQATACHNVEVDTSSLDITYNDVQTVPPFPAVPSSPCDGDFISSHYDDLTDRFSSCGGPHECAPCENAPPPPAPAPVCSTEVFSELDGMLKDGWSDDTWGTNALLRSTYASHPHYVGPNPGLGDDERMHGPWGLSMTEIERSWPVTGLQCTFAWTSYGLATRDNEVDRVFINGVKIWEQSMIWRIPSGSYWDKVFENTWTGDCDSDGDGQFTVKWTSGVNQDIPDEGWGFNNVVLTQICPDPMFD